jgi:hypothetical protein
MNPLGGASFRSSSGRCAASGRAFVAGEAYVACLVESATGELGRADVSKDAWDGGFRPEGRVFGNWKTSFRAHAAVKKALLSDDELTGLFEGLGDPTEAKQRSFRFVLALLLVRRRVMKVVGSRDRALVLVPRRAGEVPVEYVVPDPGMDDRAVADAIEQLSDVLAGDEVETASAPVASGGVAAPGTEPERPTETAGAGHAG